MAQIYPVGQEQPKSHTILAAGGAGLVIGALAGGGFEKMPLVPKEAKITSVQQLVDAMTGQDKFELKIPESASKEAKEAAESFKSVVKNTNTSFSEDYIKQIVKQDPILKGRDVVTVEEFLTEQGVKLTDKIKADPVKYFKKQAKALDAYSTVSVPIHLGGRGTRQTEQILTFMTHDLSPEQASKQLLNQLKRFGAIDKKAKTLPQTIYVTDELANKYLKAHMAYMKNMDIREGLSCFKDGKLTKDMLVDGQKSFLDYVRKSYINSDEAKSAFAKVQEYLPKVNNKLKGAMIWGAICAVGAGTIAHFMTANKKSA